MYIQHIPYRGIGSKRTYKLRILCKYIIITFCCQLFFPTKISGDTCAPPDTILSFILLSVNTIFYLEIHLCVIVAALQELLHLLLAWLSWVGACTCIKYRRSQAVSPGTHSPEQSPAHMDSCQVHNS